MTFCLPRLHLLLAVVAIAGCKPKTQPAGDRTEILIGSTLPLTGGESRLGVAYKEGYELAFDEAGGLDVGGNKIKVKLTLLDDTTVQATAVSLADKLINSDKVDFFLGTY